ncbi:MAG: hypothetical protein JST62_08725, partial [Bacteroidetes bacterium]|nr:hypothetical protein [Bacteroidota bacterium]
KRSTVIVANSKNFSVLAENNPDAIMNKAFDLVANFTQDTKLTADAKLSIVRNALQLNKHSSSELFAANALYRLNEMYNNTLNVDSARLETKNENKENQISIRSVGYKSQLLTANNYVSIFDSILSKTVQLSKSEAEIAKQIKLENISDNIDELKSLMLKQESNLKKMSKKNDSLFLLNKKKLDSLGKKNNERLEKLEKPKS